MYDRATKRHGDRVLVFVVTYLIGLGACQCKVPMSICPCQSYTISLAPLKISLSVNDSQPLCQSYQVSYCYASLRPYAVTLHLSFSSCHSVYQVVRVVNLFLTVCLCQKSLMSACIALSLSPFQSTLSICLPLCLLKR